MCPLSSHHFMKYATTFLSSGPHLVSKHFRPRPPALCAVGSPISIRSEGLKSGFQKGSYVL